MVSDKKIEKYRVMTEEALKKVKESKFDKQGDKLLDMAERYFLDAQFFLEKGKKEEAYGAICYAHAFLDAGTLLGIFKVKDSRLFMVDE